MLRKAGRDFVRFFKKSMMSSANRLILCSQLPIVTPRIRGCDLIVRASGSMDNTNKRGDSGHPWRVPLVSLNGLDVMEFVKTAAVGPLYNNETHLIIFCPKPNLGSISNRYGHSNLSKAFSQSRESRATSGDP